MNLFVNSPALADIEGFSITFVKGIKALKMKKFNLKSLLPHLIAVAIFVVFAAIFCKPALEGKVLQQSDNVQWKAMYEDQRKYEEKYGKLPLWTKNMFSGMPAYQIALKSPNPISIGIFYDFLSLGMPKPIYFFVIASLCFYLLCLFMGISPYVGWIGGLSYAFATYNAIIISVGHDTKMLAIAFIPALIGSLYLIFEKKYLYGTALTALFTALMVGANHPQITYYTLLIILFMGGYYLIQWIKAKEFKHILTSIVLSLGAGIIGLLCNAVVLSTTYEYSKASIRGGSVLADEKSSNDKNGLNKSYALSYSFYKSEPLVMLFPHLYGGSSGNLEVAEEKSKAIEALQQMPQELGQQLQSYLQFYWGGITQGTAGPPYSGAIICFLALLGLSFIPNKHKWWMIGVTVLAFFMSWGLYWENFNVFLLNNLPFYNKFRAPSMILVIPTFLFVLSAAVASQELLFGNTSKELLQKYKKGIYVVLGVFALALVIYVTSDFKSSNETDLIEQVGQIQDAQQRNAILPSVKSFVSALQEDRKGLLLGDIFRALILITIAGASIWMVQLKKLKPIWAISIVGLASMIDLLSVDSNYLNENNYQEKEEQETYFTPQPVNLEIAKDTGYYRVFDITSGVNGAFNGNAITSVFHTSIGGYHAAKLSIYQDLIEKQLYKFPNCMPTINMLNTRYFIYSDQNTGEKRYQYNPDAAGACWFVDSIQLEKNPAAVMKALDSLNVKQKAIIERAYKGNNIATSGDSIWIVSNLNDEVNYQSQSTADRFAVFSEVYYEKGWKAYVDRKETPIYKTNYVLRGIQVPAGKHEIRFEFKPDSYYKSQKLELVASGIIWLLLALSAFQLYKQNKQNGLT